MLIAFNKPYGVLCQFSPSGNKHTLADHIDIPDVYPAGRLDADSEGLLLLTDDGTLQNAIAHPLLKLNKRYWAQVEGIPDASALEQLRTGIQLSDFRTLPAKVQSIPEPLDLWTRRPPIRYRAEIPTSWIELEITEGKNRQVRRMTAAVGHPTLRLIRCGIGLLHLQQLQLASGSWVSVLPDKLGLASSGLRKKSLSTSRSPKRYGK